VHSRREPAGTEKPGRKVQGRRGVPYRFCCGGRLRLVALIDQASVILRILRHLGLPTDLPEPRPARAPPRHLDFTDDQSQDAPEFDAAW
jgi:hypothetical protein